MKLYRPLKPNLISQGYGLAKTNSSMLPKYQAMGLKAHNGIDFVCPRGERILWNGYDVKGLVVGLSLNPNEGLGVIVQTQDKDGIFQHRFWHLMEIKCKVGQVLNSGDLIGLADSTGFSTGDHLHWDLKELDENLKIKNYDNGYFGAIDPEKYFVNIFIGDVLDLISKQIEVIQRMINKLTLLLKK